jgi:hypothetical protein
MTYGVTPTGFVIKPFEVIEQEFVDKIHSVPGMEDVSLDAEDVGGKLAGPFLSIAKEMWELGAAIHAGYNPDEAIGFQQDAINALRGVRRLPAAKGTVPLRVTLAAGASIPVGKLVAQVQGQPGNRWISTEVATNPTASTADFTVKAQAEFVGPTNASAGTITQIAAPAVGWLAVTNDVDATPGRNVETHAEFRVRAEEEGNKTGASTLPAVVKAVRALPGVVRAFGFENTKDYVNSDGLPPHSIEIVVQGGDDAAIAACIWAFKGGGIETHSSNTPKSSGTTVDENGETRTVYWTRPTVRLVYLRYTLSKKTTYPGDATFKAAIAAWADANVGAGDALKYADLICQGKDQPGVSDAAVTLGFAPSPLGTSNLVALQREILDVDTGRIVVLG